MFFILTVINIKFFLDISLIKNSIFESYNSKIISITNTPSELQILECFFNNIVSNGNGGAIYFSSPTNGKSYLNKNCFYSCGSPDGWGIALYINTGSTNNNSCDLLSHVYCSRTPQLGYVGGVDFDGGIQYINYINGSYSQAQNYAAISLRGSNNCKIKFSSFINNFAERFICICFNRYSLNNAENLNVINNSQKDPSWGIVANHYYSNSYMNKCIFDKNTNNFNSNLFVSDGGIFQISNCWIQLSFSTSNVQIISNNLLTNTFPINFFITKLCKGEIIYFSNNSNLFFNFFKILFLNYFF